MLSLISGLSYKKTQIEDRSTSRNDTTQDPPAIHFKIQQLNNAERLTSPETSSDHFSSKKQH